MGFKGPGRRGCFSPQTRLSKQFDVATRREQQSARQLLWGPGAVSWQCARAFSFRNALARKAINAALTFKRQAA